MFHESYDVAIVGAGFSGALVAANLLRKAEAPLRIALFEKEPRRMGRGVAYGTEDDCHLLNVPARNMSAFPDLPDHFLEWALRHSERLVDGRWVTEVSPSAFLPRRGYGEYIVSLLAESEGMARPGVVLERRQAEIVGIAALRNGVRLVAASGEVPIAGRAALALGNFHPRDPTVSDPDFYDDSRYIANPWDGDGFGRIAQTSSCLLIGTGLTMIDWVLSLRKRGYRGTIHVLSRRGFWPRSHRAGPPAELDGEFWRVPRTACDLLKYVRGRIRALAADAEELPWRSVIDSLRPQTQRLWQDLPHPEKRRFLRHLRQYWDVHRHRVAPAVAASLDEWLHSGHMVQHIGWLEDCRLLDRGVQVSYKPRGGADSVSFEVDAVVNCSGSESDYRKLDSPLVGSLLQQGLARPDRCFLGLEADRDGRLIDRDGRPSSRLFTLGPPQKGILWETTAVPEIRVQAARLAETLLKTA